VSKGIIAPSNNSQRIFVTIKTPDQMPQAKRDHRPLSMLLK
jgi:hypothetical protein